MLKFSISVLLILFSSQVFSKGQLVATPLNSPVKETYLKVELKGANGIDSVYFKPKNGSIEFKGILSNQADGIIGSLKTSNLQPGNYEYRVRVKSSSGNSDQNEASSISFIKFTIDQSLNVVDPGEAGKKTVLGVDSNQNQVRDDVERWILENEKNQEIKNVMLEKAKAIQLTFAFKDDQAKSIQYTRQNLKAQACLRYLQLELGNSPREITEKTMQLSAMMANTRERILIMDKVSSNFHGQTVTKPTKDQACQF